MSLLPSGDCLTPVEYQARGAKCFRGFNLYFLTAGAIFDRFVGNDEPAFDELGPDSGHVLFYDLFVLVDRAGWEIGIFEVAAKDTFNGLDRFDIVDYAVFMAAGTHHSPPLILARRASIFFINAWL